MPFDAIASQQPAPDGLRLNFRTGNSRRGRSGEPPGRHKGSPCDRRAFGTDPALPDFPGYPSAGTVSFFPRILMPERLNRVDAIAAGGLCLIEGPVGTVD